MNMTADSDGVDIPQPLRAPANAAVDWINRTQQQNFELTGVVDYENALRAAADEPIELGIVLCDGEICTREQVQIIPTNSDYEVNLQEAVARDIPPLLDPPEGVRTKWLQEQLNKYEFVLLLFYRGLW